MPATTQLSALASGTSAPTSQGHRFSDTSGATISHGAITRPKCSAFSIGSDTPQHCCQ